MIPKTKGAEDECPSCHQTLVCREVTYKDETKLQWQYKDKEVAHFSFDFKTKKSNCKESGAKPNDSVAVTHSADQLNISNIEVTGKEEIMEATEDGTKRLLIVLSGVQRLCKEAGVTHPATVGMIFNQVCENRRVST